ncbi:CHAT domain-containing protein [Mucilaginibacter jinjuensis]|uniref:CHAT domain-containing protein n=1 Tax=Mucilaginibacter jinjuensis TaxID=1176721 RepID=A0ABY7T5B8_9SPHI|nr:CHAT domain-containing protein [Mucilaginibacter jinjuensis]WCT11567.1 CHAT domain-containing protein [Mucilaginibacter jinjuensis]
MHQNLLYRHGQRSSINYVLVIDEQPKTYSFVPPTEFQNEIIRFISYLPKDILQISESLTYYELVKRNSLDDPYRFHIKYSVNLEEYLKLMPINRIYLFFIDSKSSLIKQNVTLFAKYHTVGRFYYFFNDKGNKTTILPNQISGPGHFMRELYTKQQDLFNLMGMPDKWLSPETAIGWNGFYHFPSFIPAQTNYRIANTITGNFTYEDSRDDGKITEEKILAHRKASNEGHKNPNSFSRQLQIIEEIDKIDFFAETCFDEGLIKPVHEIEPFLVPLILVAPFQNPDMRDFLSEGVKSEYKEYLSELDFEQTENYINSIRPPKSAEAFLISSRLMGLKTQFLDDIAFLHSSFYSSPIVRLPTQGKTMYRNLSFFRNEAAGRITAPGSRNKIFKTIQSFGQQLRHRTLSKELTEKLRDENRQIVAISDLPVEWMDIEGIPMAFTHDICRLPETALHGLMANFVSHEQWQYLVPKDILKKTLVVFGSDEPAFRKWYPGVCMVGEKNGVIMRECYSLAALKKAVDEVSPDFLIIDSHGSYDKESKSSVLFFGKERLTGDMVIELGISAPLVFLSACSTAPTYGTINTIANAFFERGALSVTTTYLPIGVDTGSILYIRILNNLITASQKPMHQNWLAFISHMLRTSAVGAAYRHHYQKNTGDPLGSPDAQSNDYTYLLSFYHRRQIFTKMTKGIGPNLAASIPEFLFYSILGRADLIKFENWEEEFQKANPM